jgi:hypothetical protein
MEFKHEGDRIQVEMTLMEAETLYDDLRNAHFAQLDLGPVSRYIAGQIHQILNPEEVDSDPTGQLSN